MPSSEKMFALVDLSNINFEPSYSIQLVVIISLLKIVYSISYPFKLCLFSIFRWHPFTPSILIIGWWCSVPGEKDSEVLGSFPYAISCYLIPMYVMPWSHIPLPPPPDPQSLTPPPLPHFRPQGHSLLIPSPPLISRPVTIPIPFPFMPSSGVPSRSV